jgi:S-DNA-T family DNA segregation ATPase FtsK/SpoIIIE
VVTQYGLVPGWVRRYREVKERNEDGSQARSEDGKLISSRVEEKTRVKVDHILAREKDLALALAAPSLRFEAPVPGESFVGLEVPNSHREVVTLRSILESTAFQDLQKKAKLPIALGQGSGGEPVITDLADMPHILIAGATGSGKSVCINTIICSLMMQLTPLDLQMYLVDPKRVELTAYNGLPHLAGPVLVEADQAVPALHALIAEMQSRYKRFEAIGARNIQGYNAKVPKQEDRIPYLMLVIDELADLMMTSPGDVEYALCRLAQLGRATGIHLVVATQRPSVDVLTGLIKANFPSRASFAVSSQVDSRTVLDGAGADKLLGRGDMLFMPTNATKPKRVQGTYISDEEVDGIVSFWQKQKGNGQPLPSVQVDLAPADSDDDDDFQKAMSYALSHKSVSATSLMKELRIGYPKASNLLDHLEDKGIVGPGDPGKSREVITSG